MIDTSRSMVYHINNLNSESERISTQIATGKAIDKGSDDAMLHARLINLEDKLRVTEDLKLQLSKTEALNDVADQNMAELKDVLDAIKVDIMKGLNSGIDRSDKLALATNLEGMRENIFDLVTAHVDGEYIFTGSDTTKETLLKDSNFVNNGQIDFNGDGFLREVAVQPGSYRDRGLTAYDVSFYTTSTASVGETFTFNYGERIIDEDGYEWVIMNNNEIPFDKATMGADIAANPNDYSLRKLDKNGKLFDSSLYPETKIPIQSSVAETESTATTQAVQATFTINVIQGTAAGQQPESRVFEAKHNYFDDLNILINAYEGYVTNLDGTKGAVASDTVVDDTLRTQLENTSKQFDATNIGHGELGGRNKTFEVAMERIATQETHYNILIQDIGGADLAKLAMESSSLEVTYQSLYSTISKMNNMSLVNFLS
jgi:flagellar hook-associated protein 3 FlgL